MNLLDTNAVKQMLANGVTVIDARTTDLFAQGFLEGALSMPVGETFINTLNDLLSDNQGILIIADEDNLPAIAKALKQSGTVTAEGFYTGNYETWRSESLPTDILITIEADEFAMDYQFDEFFLIDVRTAEEFAAEHAEDAENIQLGELEQMLTELDTAASYYVYGNNAADAVTAGSFFKSFGFQRVRAVASTLEEVKNCGIPWFVQKKKSTTEK